MNKNVELRFSSRRFWIEQATMFVHGRQLGTVTDGTAQPIGPVGPERSGPNSAPPLETYSVVNSAATVSLDHAGRLQGILFLPSIRRVSGGLSIGVLFTKFDHDVTQEEWGAGAALIDFDSYREVRIRVHDNDGRPVGSRTLALTDAGDGEAGMDMQTDKDGEVKLLLAPGRYAVGGGKGFPRTDFEVTTSDEEQVIQLATPKAPPSDEN